MKYFTCDHNSSQVHKYIFIICLLYIFYGINCYKNDSKQMITWSRWLHVSVDRAVSRSQEICCLSPVLLLIFVTLGKALFFLYLSFSSCEIGKRIPSRAFTISWCALRNRRSKLGLGWGGGEEKREILICSDHFKVIPNIYCQCLQKPNC